MLVLFIQYVAKFQLIVFLSTMKIQVPDMVIINICCFDIIISNFVEYKKN